MSTAPMTALSRPRVSNRRPFHGLSTRTKSARAARSRWVAARAAGDAKPKAKVAVFVSGGGSNLRALHAAMEDGRVNAEVAVVVSNIPSCGGVEWSRERGIPTLTYPPKKGEGEFHSRAHIERYPRVELVPQPRAPHAPRARSPRRDVKPSIQIQIQIQIQNQPSTSLRPSRETLTPIPSRSTAKKQTV